MQHYAVKTIENVVSQGGEWAARFASESVAADLLTVWVTNRTEVLKATAASTLSRLLRYNPGLLDSLLDRFGTRHFVAGATKLRCNCCTASCFGGAEEQGVLLESVLRFDHSQGGWRDPSVLREDLSIHFSDRHPILENLA